MPKTRRIPGLIKRPIYKEGTVVGHGYHIDKVVDGQRLCESCETSDPDEAERYLIHRLEQLRQQRLYGGAHRAYLRGSRRAVCGRKHPQTHAGR